MIIKKYDTFEGLKNDINIDPEYQPIFLHPKYAEMIKATKGWIMSWYIGFVDEVPLYLLPMAVKKTRYYTKGQCYFSTIYLTNEKNKEEEFLDSFVSFVKENKVCDWIQQGSNWAFFSKVPKDAVFCDFGTYRVDLTKDENPIRKSDLRYLKRAKENCVLYNDDIKSVSEIINVVYKKTNLKKINSQTINTEKTLLSNNMIILSVNLEEKLQSAIVAYKTNHSIYGIYAGTIRNSFKGVTQLMYNEIYNYAKENNIKYFDFVGAVKNLVPGSKFYNIQMTKRHLGGEELWGYLWRYPINKQKYFLYKLALKTYCKLKGKRYGDIIYRETGK